MRPLQKAKAKAIATFKVPPVKYGLIVLAIGLWGFGLMDQLESLGATVKYLALTTSSSRTTSSTP